MNKLPQKLPEVQHLPVSHILPVYPELQLQVYPLTRSKHSPCTQGELAHSSLSMKSKQGKKLSALLFALNLSQSLVYLNQNKIRTQWNIN